MSRRKKEDDPRTTHERQRDFLAAWADTFSVERAAKKAHIDRGTHCRWYRKNAKYALAFEKRKEIAGQYLDVAAGGHRNRELKRVLHFRGIPSP